MRACASICCHTLTCMEACLHSRIAAQLASCCLIPNQACQCLHTKKKMLYTSDLLSRSHSPTVILHATTGIQDPQRHALGAFQAHTMSRQATQCLPFPQGVECLWQALRLPTPRLQTTMCCRLAQRSVCSFPLHALRKQWMYSCRGPHACLTHICLMHSC